MRVQEWQLQYEQAVDSLRRGRAILLKLRAPCKPMQSAVLHRAVASHGTAASVEYLRMPRIPDPWAPRELSDCILRVSYASKLAEKASRATDGLLSNIQASSKSMVACDTLCRLSQHDRMTVNVQTDQARAAADVNVLERALVIANCVEGMARGSELLTSAAAHFHLDVCDEDAEALLEMLGITPFVHCALAAYLAST